MLIYSITEAPYTIARTSLFIPAHSRFDLCCYLAPGGDPQVQATFSALIRSRCPLKVIREARSSVLSAHLTARQVSFL